MVLLWNMNYTTQGLAKVGLVVGGGCLDRSGDLRDVFRYRSVALYAGVEPKLLGFSFTASFDDLIGEFPEVNTKLLEMVHVEQNVCNQGALFDHPSQWDV